MRFNLARVLLSFDEPAGGKLLDAEDLNQLRTVLNGKPLQIAPMAIQGIANAANYYAEHNQQGRADELFNFVQSLVENSSGPDTVKDIYFTLILYLKGLGYYHQNDFEQALKFSDKALELSPGDPWSNSLRAWTLTRQKNYDKATESFRKLSDLNDDEPDGYLGLSFIDLRLKRFRDCIADANEALKLDPCSAAGYNYRGQANLSLGKCSEALTDFNKAIEFRDIGEYHYHRGRAYAKLKQEVQAKLDFQRAKQLNYVPESDRL